MWGQVNFSRARVSTLRQPEHFELTSVLASRNEARGYADLQTFGEIVEIAGAADLLWVEDTALADSDRHQHLGLSSLSHVELFTTFELSSQGLSHLFMWAGAAIKFAAKIAVDTKHADVCAISC